MVNIRTTRAKRKTTKRISRISIRVVLIRG